MMIRTTISRTTPMMLSSQLYARLRATQSELLQKQREITSGKEVMRPSDGADRVSGILFLRQQLQAREQHARNMDHAKSVLDNTDAAIADATEIVREAKAIASSQIGVGSDSATRSTQGDVVSAQLQALLDVANRQFNGVSLFGGTHGAPPADGQVFVEFLGGVRYIGSTENVRGDIGALEPHPFTSNGLDAFGALSSRVKTKIDLQPRAAADTRLADIRGAANAGVRDGSVLVNVNGTEVAVDLTSADTLGDVTTRINDAIDSVAAGAGSLAIAGEGFQLNSTAGNTITISEVGAGKTAGDLGVGLTASGGASAAGPSVEPKLVLTTRLADLGTAVDWASGLTITQGEVTKTADFSAATTVEDVINAVHDLGLGLRMEVNADGTGLDMVSEVSGIRLSVGENGGTTADDLGIRTLALDTELSAFRDGLGVEDAAGDDFRVTLHDGRSFDVDIAGATEVGDVVAAIQAAATAAGVAAADFSVGLAANGNGIAMSDTTAGGGSFTVTNLGLSLAADHLGIKKDAGAATTLTGDDNATVRAEGVFTHLIDLRDALKNDSTSGITLAGSRIETDLDSLARAHASVGVTAKRLEDHQQRSEDLKLTEETMLSDLQDADLAEVITRFTQLQMQLEASMQVGAQNLQFSLLDFLR